MNAQPLIFKIKFHNTCAQKWSKSPKKINHNIDPRQCENVLSRNFWNTLCFLLHQMNQQQMRVCPKMDNGQDRGFDLREFGPKNDPEVAM
jgi:hypothetical protein